MELLKNLDKYMTKKDYNILAAAILRASDGQDNVRNVVEAIAEALSYDNPNFQYARFMEACGFQD